MLEILFTRNLVIYAREVIYKLILQILVDCCSIISFLLLKLQGSILAFFSVFGVTKKLRGEELIFSHFQFFSQLNLSFYVGNQI